MTTSEKMPEKQQDDLAVFMMVKTLPEWLGLHHEERFAHLTRYMKPIMTKYQDQVRCRMFDTEFYSTRVTDVWMWEATSRHAYEMAMEEMRETPLWDRFFSIVEILAGVENAYARNYEREPVTA